uniref:PARP catalytic domain-containing protein n=1 Tax=Oncorhynchus tshawytscha TaxID=74940 RepID=A0A8C8C7D4_ONCTS
MWRRDYFTTSAGARRMGLSGPRNGRIYIMYHGTSWWAAQKIMAKDFCPSKCGMLGQGVYLSRDLEKASRYPLDLTEHQKVVIKTTQDHPLQKTWHGEGYDSAWVPPNCGMVKSGLEETCVWDPNRITVLDVYFLFNFFNNIFLNLFFSPISWYPIVSSYYLVSSLQLPCGLWRDEG